MIILDDTKTLTTLATDTSNGLGQIGCINPTITENLNGSYELEFDIATSEKYFSLLHTGGLIKCLHNTSEQIFRIYFISKAINGIVNVKAQHITYDLCGVVVKPFTATGAVSSVNGMLTNVIGSTPFTMTTDITNTTSNFTLDIPRSFRECLGGYEGSLLDVFRGEYEWDNLTARMLAHRGADNGVRIAYGKNLTDFTQEENVENVFDAVYGYAVIDDVFYQPSGIYNKTGATTPKVKIVDFSSDYESGDTPSQADLYAKAQTYATNNPIEVPNVNIKVSFVPLWQTEEYKNILPLERVSLGDTVHVFFEKLNVEATSRVIKTVWNVNLERYDEIELGDAKANLNTVINESVDSAVNNAIGDLDIDTGAIESEMFQMSKLIANGMGLHMTKDSIGRIFLHNTEDLSQSQYQYMITANGFMISNNYGQEGSWTSGWDADGNVVVNSLATITLKFLQGYGMYMRFGDINSNYIEVAPYSDSNNNPMGVSFDGSGSVRFQPQNEFIVRNTGANSSLYNYLYMHHDNSGNVFSLENRYYNGTTNIANSVSMQSNSSGNIMYVMNKRQGASTNANFIQFSATSTTNAMSLTNVNLGQTTNANAIGLGSYNGGYNSATMSNNYYSTSDTANRVQLYATSTNANIDIENGRWTSGSSSYVTNYISMQKTSSASKIYMRNRLPSQNYDANHLLMFFENGQSSVELTNYNSSGGEMNYLKFNVNGDGTARLYADSDLRLMSGGAVRIESGYSQDVTIYGADDVSITYNDKFHIIQGSTDRVISFGSDGNVKWAYAS